MFNEKKHKIAQNFARHEKDTGSSEVQIALLTSRITELTAHLKIHAHDHHSRRGLLKLVARRRSLLKYLMRVSRESYKRLIDALSIRK